MCVWREAYVDVGVWIHACRYLCTCDHMYMEAREQICVPQLLGTSNFKDNICALCVCVLTYLVFVCEDLSLDSQTLGMATCVCNLRTGHRFGQRQVGPWSSLPS